MRRISNLLGFVGLVGLVTVCAPKAAAQDLFEIRLRATDNSQPDLRVGGSSLLDLVEGLINTDEDFLSYDGVPFDASLNYAGVANAIQFSLNAAGDDATLTFSAIGADATVWRFTGADVEDQIEDFLKGEAPAELGRFLKAIARQSLVAVTDGNPNAATAVASRYRHTRFGAYAGFTPRRATVVTPSATETPTVSNSAFFFTDFQDEEETKPARKKDSAWIWRIEGSAGTIDTDVGDGFTFDLVSSTELPLNDRISIVVGVPLSYQQIEQADIYHMGIHADVPIKLALPETEGKGLTWQITPGAMIGGAGSAEFIAGGALWGFGITNLVMYEIENWAFQISNQYDTHKSITLKFQDFEFDPDISQQILINGAKVTYAFSDDWSVYGGVSYSQFLKDAAIDSYYSPGIGVSYARKGRIFEIGYEGDVADDYKTHKARFAIRIPF